VFYNCPGVAILYIVQGLLFYILSRGIGGDLFEHNRTVYRRPDDPLTPREQDIRPSLLSKPLEQGYKLGLYNSYREMSDILINE
jgi:hypothetical protein